MTKACAYSRPHRLWHAGVGEFGECFRLVSSLVKMALTVTFISIFCLLFCCSVQADNYSLYFMFCNHAMQDLVNSFVMARKNKQFLISNSLWVTKSFPCGFPCSSHSVYTQPLLMTLHYTNFVIMIELHLYNVLQCTLSSSFVADFSVAVLLVRFALILRRGQKKNKKTLQTRHC